MAHTIELLRKLSDAELIEKHDLLAQYGVENVEYYLNELARRDQSRQAALLVRYTRILLVLTVIVTVATVASLAVVIFR